MRAPTVRYDIHDMTSVTGRCYLGERPTFDEAEHFARWHAARRGIRVEIGKTTQTAKHRHDELVATVTRDALGRLWTDLTWHGATLVGEG
jgi:hypothetical protein